METSILQCCSATAGHEAEQLGSMLARARKIEFSHKVLKSVIALRSLLPQHEKLVVVCTLCLGAEWPHHMQEVDATECLVRLQHSSLLQALGLQHSKLRTGYVLKLNPTQGGLATCLLTCCWSIHTSAIIVQAALAHHQ